jgi:UDP:flavonoid glycosyltransferase YjiC (YdhE family)
MIVVPHGRDQADNAVRVTERGAGVMLPSESDAAVFRSAIAAILADPNYTEAARALGERVAEDVRNSPVLAELEALASGSLEIDLKVA